MTDFKEFYRGQQKGIGVVFKATNRLKESYIYQFRGIDEKERGVGYMHLYNFTEQVNTDVEQEWFNQRQILVLKDADAILKVSLKKFKKETKHIGVKYFIVGERYRNAAQTEFRLIKSESGFFVFLANKATMHMSIDNSGTFVPGIASTEMEMVHIG